jgi:hypothetical protein
VTISTNRLRALLLLVILIGISGCSALRSSLTASEFYAEFPRLTSTRYLDGAVATVATENGECIVLQIHRVRAAIGATVYIDMQNGAQDVDGIVINEGGNSYRMTNFQWVDVNSSTQLVLEFTSMLCE